MKIDLKHKKTVVMGVTGSGKTYLVENYLIRNFRKPFVYLIHKEDFRNTGDNVQVYIPQINGNIDISMEHLERISKLIKEKAIRGEIDALIIDEADMFIPKDLRAVSHKYPNFYDLVINHRHYGLNKGEGMALILITRRPQEMPTMIIEQSHHSFMFALEGKNVISHMSSIHQDYEMLMQRLSVDEHNFIYKRIGSPPELHSRITVTNKQKGVN